jgi:hypothetical protein
LFSGPSVSRRTPPFGVTPNFERNFHRYLLGRDADDYRFGGRIDVGPLAVDADRGEGATVAVDGVPLAAIAAVGIAETNVDMTFFEGRKVYERGVSR